MELKLETHVSKLYNSFGQQKPMGGSSTNWNLPHYFLLRSFQGENDLLTIFNTKRCQYQCYFCQLPAKSSRFFIPAANIVSQFKFVAEELRHALSIIDRVTISNEGSVLDSSTFPFEALVEITKGVNQMRRVRSIVLETRLEFVKPDAITKLRMTAKRCKIIILTGFETHDEKIRESILNKKETLSQFLNGLDMVATANSELTAYILYKPDQRMTDEAAFQEADESIDFLVRHCRERLIPLTIRLNPMYLANGSRWARIARATPNYKPPKLTDVMKLAEQKSRQGVSIYVGLSTEGFDATAGSYLVREDYSKDLIKQVILFNNKIISSFDLS